MKIFIVDNQEGLDNGPFNLLKKGLEVVDSPHGAEAIVVFGGDGTMLEAIRQYKGYTLPFYGFNSGHIGFLMNEASDAVLGEITSGAVDLLDLRLLSAILTDENGQEIGTEMAFNDFYFERASTQIAKVRVSIDNTVRLESLYCDGVLVCTPAGSTAYNAAANGIVLPIDSNSIVVTGICPAIFHSWRTTQLPDSSTITMEALEAKERPVRFLADGIETAGVAKAEIQSSNESITLGFARTQAFREKVLSLQFAGTQESGD